MDVNFKISCNSDSLFLTDGQTGVRYGDIIRIHRQLHGLLTEIVHKKQTVGINTEDRIQAVLWMVLCWIRNIPFVPYHRDFPDPLKSFQPDMISDQQADIRQYLSDSDNHVSGHNHKSGPFPDTVAGIYPGSADTTRNTAIPGDAMIDPFRYPVSSVFCGMLTSGSSGKPQKVPLFRHQIIAAVNNAVRTSQLTLPDSHHNPGHAMLRNSGNTSLWGHCLPLYHTGGLTIVFRAFLTGSGIFLWNRFNEKEIHRDLSRHADIRQLSLVPTMLKRLMDYTDTLSAHASFFHHSLENILVGGGPSPAGLIHGARKRGWPVVFSYGMTETCGQVSAQAVNGTSPSDSAGMPFPDHTVTIRDEQGHPVPAGTSGTVWVEGPQVFAGYLSDSCKLADYRPNHEINPDVRNPYAFNLINTGDFGRFDKQGNLYIEARRTDLVISGGMNIRPAEVEEVLLECPYVADAGVTGIPDTEWGQRLVALVVSADNPDVLNDTELESAISGFLTNRLKPHQRPKEIFPVKAIPRTALGKIKRSSLQELAINLLAGK